METYIHIQRERETEEKVVSISISLSLDPNIIDLQTQRVKCTDVPIVYIYS